MKEVFRTIITTLAVAVCFCACAGKSYVTSEDEAKARIVVLTDAEIDDQCSMVRFLLSTNEFETEGIITTSSQFHWVGHNWAGNEWLAPYLKAYREVYPSLSANDPAYPTPDYLESVSLLGNINGEGEMEEVTPGSEFIVNLLLDESDSRPIWFQAWGGLNTLSRALKTIAEEHPEKMEYVASKMRIYSIWEQDNTYQDYIKPVWGKYNIPTILSDQFWAMAYSWRQLMYPEMRQYFQKEWNNENILNGHGPLCALYHTRGGDFISEGDSPSFIYNIRTGLGNMEHPDWGSWGGRYDLYKDNIYIDPAPIDDPDWVFSGGRYNPGSAWLGQHRGMGEQVTLDYYGALTRWCDALQNDFAAKADWCVKPYNEANHAPKAVVKGEQARTVSAGESLKMNAAKSSDPDGDTLNFKWFQYKDAGTGKGELQIENAQSANPQVTVPTGAVSGETYHLICQVTDSGTPALTRYARIILTIK